MVPRMDPGTESLYDFLTQALDGSGLGVELIGGVHVIFPLPIAADSAATMPSRTNFSLLGIVRDRTSGEPLPFASLGIVGTSIATSANSDGKFSLLRVPSDTSVIAVRYIGYRALDLPLSAELAGGYLVIELMPQDKILPSVLISVEKEPLVQLDAEPGLLTFNPAETSKLPMLGEADLFNAMRWLPGITGTPQTGTGLRLRGSFSDQNLVLFDGIPVYHIDHLFGYFSAFNSHVVKNVQVYNGGFGTEYGGRTAGVINITGIEGNTREASLLAEVNSMSTNAVAQVPIVPEKASLVVAYRRGFTDVVQSPTFQNIFNNLYNTRLPANTQTNVNVFRSGEIPDFNYYDFNTKFTFKPTVSDAISLSFYSGYDRLGMAFSTPPAQVTRTTNDLSQWGNTGGSLKWSRKWNKKWFSYFNAGLSTYNSNLEAEETFVRSDNVPLSIRFFDQRFTLRDLSLRLDQTYQYSDNTKLEVGYWYTGYRLWEAAQDQSTILRDSTQQAVLQALYAQIDHKQGIWRAKVGVRLSPYSGTDKVYTSPRLSLSANVAPTVIIKAAAGRYFQMIRRLNERSIYFSIPETWALAGHGNIPVLESDQLTAGATWKKHGWEIDAELWLKREVGTTELLFPWFGLPSPIRTDLLTGGRRALSGGDLLVKRDFGKQSVMLTYTLTRVRSRYPVNNLPSSFAGSGFPLHEGTLVFSRKTGNWIFSAAATMVSGLPYTEALSINGLNIIFGPINAARTPWNHRVDMACTRTIALRKAAIEIGASIYNVYNHRPVQLFDFFILPNPNGSDSIARREVPALGITPSAFVRLRL